jgi:hypothetical protein
MKIPRVPKVRGQYFRPGDNDDLVDRAAGKNKRKRASGRLATTGRPHPEGWKDSRAIGKADPAPRKVAGVTNPNPDGYAPTGAHRDLRTAQKSHRGRRRHTEDEYAGRHRKAYEGKHRRG